MKYKFFFRGGAIHPDTDKETSVNIMVKEFKVDVMDLHWKNCNDYSHENSQFESFAQCVDSYVKQFSRYSEQGCTVPWLSDENKCNDTITIRNETAFKMGIGAILKNADYGKGSKGKFRCVNC